MSGARFALSEKLQTGRYAVRDRGTKQIVAYVGQTSEFRARADGGGLAYWALWAVPPGKAPLPGAERFPTRAAALDHLAATLDATQATSEAA